MADTVLALVRGAQDDEGDSGGHCLALVLGAQDDEGDSGGHCLTLVPSSTRESAIAPTKRSAVKHKYRVASNHVHIVVFTLLFSHLKVQELMIRQVRGAQG